MLSHLWQKPRFVWFCLKVTGYLEWLMTVYFSKFSLVSALENFKLLKWWGSLFFKKGSALRCGGQQKWCPGPRLPPRFLSCSDSFCSCWLRRLLDTEPDLFWLSCLRQDLLVKNRLFLANLDLSFTSSSYNDLSTSPVPFLPLTWPLGSKWQSHLDFIIGYWLV